MRSRASMHSALLLCLLGFIRHAAAYSSFMAKIPNAEKVTGCDGVLSPGVGHLKSSGGGERNAFGLAFKEAGSTWTKELCEADSDGDGRSNGRELGDPECIWSEGETPQFDSGITHPGFDCSKLECPDPSWSDASLMAKSLEPKGCDKFQADTSGSHDFRFSDIAVPDGTSYYYQAFTWPEANASAALKFEFLVENAAVVHHMILYRCNEDKSADWGTPARNPGMVQGCTDVYSAWAVGGPPFCAPEGVGFIVEPGRPHFVMQMHYDNPKNEAGIVDNSGIRIHFNPHDEGLGLKRAGTLLVGVGARTISIPPGKQNFHVRGNIPTERIADGGTFFAYAHHMHYIGKRQTLTVLNDAKGKKEEFACNSNYDFDLQEAVMRDDLYEIGTGDHLQVDCVYDSTGRTEITLGGEESKNEMCLVAMFYYPEKPGTLWMAPAEQFDDAGSEHTCGCKLTEEEDPSSSFWWVAIAAIAAVVAIGAVVVWARQKPETPSVSVPEKVELPVDPSAGRQSFNRLEETS